jgi:predicted O-methyltransferase YrrM
MKTRIAGLLPRAVMDALRERHVDAAPALSSTYRAEQVVGRTGRRFATGALSTIRNVTALRAMMRERRSTRTLEIGLALGGSTLGMAEMHRALGHSRAAHVAIDPFQSTVWDDAGRLALERTGLTDLVQVIEAPSRVALPKLLDAGERFELIYIDGSHLFEDCFTDFSFAADLMPVGGIVVFDDCLDPHVAKVISFVRTSIDTFAERDVAADRSLGQLEHLCQRVLSRTRGLQLVAFEKTKEPWRRAWNATFVEF